MSPLVKLVLGFLRLGSHTALFLEAQRLAQRLLRPTSAAHLRACEAAVLRGVRADVQSSFTGAPLPLHALCAGAAGAPPVVLLHGHSMSAAFYARNFDDLASLGRQVFAVDLLGWGRSARPVFAGATVDDTLQWYVGSLHAWAVARGLERFALVGHSLGAYVAFEYAKRYPGRVQRLVLISPAAISRRVPLLRAAYFRLPPQAVVRRGGLLGFLMFAVWYPRSACYVRDRLREYAYHLAAQTPASGEVAVRPMVAVRPAGGVCTRPMLEALDSFPAPILLVCGETDGSIDVRDVHVLAREMKRRGLDASLAVVPGADHCPHLEFPGRFFAAVKDFLAVEKDAALHAAGGGVVHAAGGGVVHAGASVEA